MTGWWHHHADIAWSETHCEVVQSYCLFAWTANGNDVTVNYIQLMKNHCTQTNLLYIVVLHGPTTSHIVATMSHQVVLVNAWRWHDSDKHAAFGLETKSKSINTPHLLAAQCEVRASYHTSMMHWTHPKYERDNMRSQRNKTKLNRTRLRALTNPSASNPSTSSHVTECDHNN